MKLLNLDNLTTEATEFVVVKGQEHAIQPISVGQFVKMARKGKEVANAGDPLAEYELIVEMVSAAIPTLPVADVESLSMESLQKLSQYISGQDVQGVETLEKKDEKTQGN